MRSVAEHRGDKVITHRRGRGEREALAVLGELFRRIGSSLDLARVLDEVLEASRRLLGTEQNLILLKENGKGLVPRAWDAFDSAAIAGVRLAVDTGVIGRVLAARTPVALGGEAMAELSGLAPQLVGGSGLLAPLTAGDRTLGLLLLAPARARSFSTTDLRLLDTLAQHAANAIEHAQLYEEATARGERLATLVRLTQRVAAQRPYEDLLRLIATEARRLLGATAAAFRLVEGNELTIAVWAGTGQGVTEPAELRIGEGPCGIVAASGQPLRIGDTGSESHQQSALYAPLRAAGVRSYLGVPLLTRERVTGVLSVYGADPERFDADDTALLSGFAGQAAVAVENARLVQQLLHAERLSAVGRSVAGVVHELNNPLAVVVGTADLIMRDRADGHVAERLQRISDQAQRAVKIVRSMLTLARKKAVTQWTPVDVNQLLAATLELEEYELRSAGVTVARRFDIDLPRILADPGQLQQVFTNLFLNAQEAIAATGKRGTLTVATHHDESTDRIVVTVSDDGPGIRPEDASRIFEPFFTTKGEEKGTGLGLAICRQIVENHRGRVTVESRPGSGASFSVELPVSRVVERGAVEAVREERSVSDAANVLLVEDEEGVGDLLAEFLALDGHRVDRAANGREALELVKGHSYALIVSDVRMPDVDGPTLYRELCALSPPLTPRMVFVTGDVLSSATRRFLDDTGLAYLEKPFGITEFQSAVREALRAP